MHATALQRRLRANDVDICLRANALCARKIVRRYFSIVSKLGDGPLWYSLILAPVMLQGAAGATASVHLAAVGLLAVALYKCLKSLTRRSRPFASDMRIRAWVAPLDEYSFPSGHTLHAVTFTIVAAAYFPISTWILAPFTASIAASRVVLGLHYPSDVIAATGIGACIALSSFWLRDFLVAINMSI
jgi:undecaprenyl-diphosphatase